MFEIFKFSREFWSNLQIRISGNSVNRWKGGNFRDGRHLLPACVLAAHGVGCVAELARGHGAAVVVAQLGRGEFDGARDRYMCS